jgi:hypothetical protein
MLWNDSGGQPRKNLLTSFGSNISLCEIFRGPYENFTEIILRESDDAPMNQFAFICGVASKSGSFLLCRIRDPRAFQMD